MIIYGAILSPFVRKVLMFAAEKGVAVEARAGGMGQGGAAFAAASPFAKMPALRDQGANADGSDYCLADSSAICTYIEAKHPAPALMGVTPQDRGTIAWYDEFADTILMAAGAKIFFNRVVLPRFLKRDGDLALADAAQADELPPIMAWLDTQLVGRDWLVGDAFSFADIAVAQPFVNLAGGECPIDGAAHPHIARWFASVRTRPSFAPLVDKVEGILAG